jgi:hypothetical protein
MKLWSEVICFRFHPLHDIIVVWVWREICLDPNSNMLVSSASKNEKEISFLSPSFHVCCIGCSPNCIFLLWSIKSWNARFQWMDEVCFNNNVSISCVVTQTPTLIIYHSLMMSYWNVGMWGLLLPKFVLIVSILLKIASSKMKQFGSADDYVIILSSFRKLQ